MTLLVLELKVPELPPSTPDDQILARLRELGPSFFTFFLTFVLSGVFGRFLHSQVATCIYYGNQFVIGTALFIQWEYTRRHQLITEDIDPLIEGRLSLRGCGGALASALVRPELAFAGFGAGIPVAVLIARLRSGSRKG